MESFLQIAWPVPFGELALKIDPLSLVFLCPVIILLICAGAYGVGYMRPYWGKRPLGAHVGFYLLFALALLLIVTANNVILFLGAWETMTITTFFLIIFSDEKEAVRKAGFLYLIASHCATFCLLIMFFLMAHFAGSMDFTVMSKVGFPLELAGIIFLLALAGFGVKAGFLPLHVWLPYAHPAAPAHISALLSGVAIKMGIYGLCRVLWIVGILPAWCGYMLIIIGVICGVMGVLYALGQHELKKLLAYHSIENIGIITLGLGVGLLGRSYDQPFLAVLGFGGGLLHVINHSLFKGLLFLAAGSVISKTHSGDIDQLGGLAKTMPVTSVLFLVGALSICGLPLFNGFISEFIIFFGLFQGVLALPLLGVIFSVLGIIALALMGALAIACFTKVYGAVFSGQPRSIDSGLEYSKTVDETTSIWMLAPMIILAWLCAWIGLAPKMMSGITFLGGACLARVDLFLIDMSRIYIPLSTTIGIAFLFSGLILGLLVMRRFILGAEPQPVREAWGCGFTRVSVRAQYTASSFARSIIDLVKNILQARQYGAKAGGYFPLRARLASSVRDVSEDMMFRPLLAGLTRLSRKIDARRVLYTQMYLMYIFLFLIFLLVWKLR
ncbi:MAG: hydrogenase [Candidatus Omnitrophica bacterium]|nr:hydrogenase [Candidatus Omnitrophota bacterium]